MRADIADGFKRVSKAQADAVKNHQQLVEAITSLVSVVSGKPRGKREGEREGIQDFIEGLRDYLRPKPKTPVVEIPITPVIEEPLTREGFYQMIVDMFQPVKKPSTEEEWRSMIDAPQTRTFPAPQVPVIVPPAVVGTPEPVRESFNFTPENKEYIKNLSNDKFEAWFFELRRDLPSAKRKAFGDKVLKIRPLPEFKKPKTDALKDTKSPDSAKKEAQMTGNLLFPVAAPNEPRLQKQGKCTYGEVTLGYYHICSVEADVKLLVIPKHFLSQCPQNTLLTFWSKDESKHHSCDPTTFVPNDPLDICAKVLPKDMEGFLPTLNLRPENVPDLKKVTQAAIFVHRNALPHVSVAGKFQNPSDNTGEAIYDCSTAPGDCGAIVWKDSGTPIGFHVGTNGTNKGNRFLFFNKMVFEFLKSVV
jgi:hypothetical protein